jgi:8-oxo-dGTP pyrophosphatase MutT (NUDIX family)
VRAVLAAHRPQEEDAPEARPAAVALILTQRADGLAILLIRRAERAGDPWSGQIALPGGRRDPGDVDLVATAIRETREETGVDLAAAERLGALDDLYPRVQHLPAVVVRPFVFALAHAPELSLSDEVSDAFWVSVAYLRDPAHRRDVKLNIRGAARTFPAYVLGDHLLWGMTERILTPFLELIAV